MPSQISRMKKKKSKEQEDAFKPFYLDAYLMFFLGFILAFILLMVFFHKEQKVGLIMMRECHKIIGETKLNDTVGEKYHLCLKLLLCS